MVTHLKIVVEKVERYIRKLYEEVIMSRLVKFLSLIMYVLILSGCSLSVALAKPPQAAVDFIMQFVDCFADKTCQQITMSDYENLPLTKANQANGITEKWCIAFTYIYQNEYTNNAWEDSGKSLVVSKTNGVWDLDLDFLRKTHDPFASNCDWARLEASK